MTVDEEAFRLLKTIANPLAYLVMANELVAKVEQAFWEVENGGSKRLLDYPELLQYARLLARTKTEKSPRQIEEVEA